MSHELRTPLNAIIGVSEMLREDAEAAGQDLEPLDRVPGARNGGRWLTARPSRASVALRALARRKLLALLAGVAAGGAGAAGGDAGRWISLLRCA
jgi:signal transduction histidine kinase